MLLFQKYLKHKFFEKIFLVNYLKKKYFIFIGEMKCIHN